MMKRHRWFRWHWLVALALLVQPAIADSNHLRGTWSGLWEPEAGLRSVTVRFTQAGDTLAGEMLTPERLPFDSVTFDTDTSSIVAEVRSSDQGAFKLGARIEDGTRLYGTLTHNGDTGDVRLTKWTYQP
jgi:hypothetical protein